MRAMAQQTMTQPVEQARLAVETASDRQASDIVLLDIRGVSDFTDYFVILTAGSMRQLNALTEDIEAALKKAGAVRHHREGVAQSGWVLLDYGDVIVHLFGEDERDFYDIEGAWSRAVEVVRIQ